MRRFKFLVLSTVATVLSFLSGAQTPQQIENAVAFTKLYGYVRYFHPSDEAASINWDRLAIYGMEKVKDSRNTKELQTNLLAVFKPIAPTLLLVPTTDKAVFNLQQLQVPDVSNYKVIAWQHSGVGTGAANSIYQSLRTYRPLPVTSGNRQNFAPLSTRLNAKELRGKEFIFSARVRMVQGAGQAQLWVRVDRPNKGTGFFNNMDDRPVLRKTWETYTIEGKVDADADAVVFGAMLMKEGEAELDDFSFKIKEGDEWKELFNENFNNTEEGKKPASLGFNYNSGYTFAVKKSEAEQVGTVRSLQPGEIKTKPHQTLFEAMPKVGEVMEKEIGGNLKMLLPLALYGSTTQTFPVGDTSALFALQEQLKLISAESITADRLPVRLADVTIAWNVFQHFYPYFDVVKTDWSQVLHQTTKEAYADKTAASFQATLQRMTAQLRDGHVRVNWNKTTARYLPPIIWEWVEGKLLITQVLDSTVSLQRGDVVKEINGRSPKDFFAPVYDRISAGTRGWLEYRAATEALMAEQDATLNLAVERQGTNQSVALRHSLTNSQYYNRFPKGDSIKMLQPDVAYINLDVASMKAINAFLPQLEKCKAIICDLRGYPNENHELLEYLLKGKDTSSRWMQVPQSIYPDRENQTWRYASWGIKPARIHLNARMIFLTDGSAISYAESYMGFVEHYKLATIIGQPTAGANGNINPFPLPGGYSISWTGMRVVKHDGSTHHTVGIQPNIFVQKTIKGVQEGRDEFLEKALEIVGVK